MDDTIFASEKDLKIKRGIVYCIYNIINNKMYIGISKNSFAERYSLQTWTKRLNQRHLQRAIKKYGPANFKVIILESNKNREELSKLEKFYIKLFATQTDQFGYNRTEGGYEGYHENAKVRDIKKVKQDLIEIYGNKLNFDFIRYRGQSKPVKILCNQCGLFFYKNPKSLIRGCGCPQCNKKNLIEKLRYSFDEFVIRARECHNNKYQYNFITNNKVGEKSKINYLCLKCSSVVEQVISSHLRGSGCRKCNQHRRVKSSKI